MEKTKKEDALIFKMLDLSTAHLQKSTMDALHGITHRHPSYLKMASEQSWPIVFDKDDYGYFIHISEDPWDLDDERIPKDLRDIMKYASALGCHWINLDRDGTIMEELTIYEW